MTISGRGYPCCYLCDQCPSEGLCYRQGWQCCRTETDRDNGTLTGINSMKQCQFKMVMMLLLVFICPSHNKQNIRGSMHIWPHLVVLEPVCIQTKGAIWDAVLYLGTVGHFVDLLRKCLFFQFCGTSILFA